MQWKEVGSLARASVSEWVRDNAARQAAALGFYTLLSMAPLVILCVSFVDLVLGKEVAGGVLVREVGEIIGREAATVLKVILASAERSGSGTVSSIIGVTVLLIGASGVFAELQEALNVTWGVAPKSKNGLVILIRERLFSFALVIGLAFVMLVSLVVSALLASVGRFMAGALPGGAILWQILNNTFSFAVIATLFAVIFKVVPDIQIRWRDVWVGAVVSAVMFTAGKQLLGLYLGTSTLTSIYGAAGSLVALVVWVYFSSQIVLLGAEFTQVFARHFGREVKPAKNAKFVTGTGEAVAGGS